MGYPVQDPRRDDDTEPRPDDLGHPRGTLALVALYALLFALGWIAIYVYRFLGRGALTP